MKNNRINPSANPFVRGFLLGMLHAQGVELTAHRIRQELLVSKATSKRDMQRVRKLLLAHLKVTTPEQRVEFAKRVEEAKRRAKARRTRVDVPQRSWLQAVCA